MSNNIAIVGIAGRFPGANSIEDFWRNLCAGRESISRFDDSELEDSFDQQTRQSPNYVKARPILDDVERFDADFFTMHAREAELTDPQHRVFLECAWEALEDAGHDPANYRGQIGVFAGSSINTYFLNNVCKDRQTIEAFTSSYQVGCYPELVGASPDFLATRVSYKLDLKGPSLTLQSACSTSLLAVAQACQSLLLYQSDMALAGGVSISFPQKRGYLHQEGGMVSKDGHCRPFDADATGTIFGSGAGVVLLKRLDEALADRNHIYAVIRGWGINNDGASKVGFTAPSVDGQAAAIEMALAMAGLDARDIGYVECHGTATPLGDPIEIAGLTNAFGAYMRDRQFCAIGSLKGNIGHLDAAAGIAGLIKTALSLSRELKPASLHFERPNPQIEFASTPFFVNDKTVPWPKGAVPRRAGVSALGVGGTNVHVILEESPTAAVDPPRTADQDRAVLLPVSAKNESGLKQACSRLASHLEEYPEQPLTDIAYTLQTGRRTFNHRIFIVSRNRQEAAAKLEERSASPHQRHHPLAKNPPVVFMFPGQGAQYPGMGRGLYEQEPEFRRQIDRCAEILEPLIAADLRDLLYSSGDSEAAHRRLSATAVAQPAIFATEYALARLWMSWGIRPSAMIGHSIGELVAAALADVFSLEAALSFVTQRGRLIQELPTGSMLAVRKPSLDVEGLLEPPLSIAAYNGPSLCVVAGPHDAVDRLEKRLEADGIMSRRLHTSHAFHSAMMEPIVEPLRARLAGMAMSAPTLPYVSCVTGDWARNQDAISPDYWAKHARQPVRFHEGIGKLDVTQWPILLEVGPGTTLSTLALQAGRGTERVVLSSLPDATRTGAERDGLLEAIGALWTAGMTPDWDALNGEARKRVSLPTYPFQRNRYWIDPPPRQEMAATTPGPTPANDSLAVADGDEINISEQPRSISNEASGDQPKNVIAAKLIAIIESLSGEPFQAAAAETSFLEMGFDSLFLSQVTQRIQKHFGIKVQFRQLLGNHSTIPLLAAHLERQLDALPGSAKVEVSAQHPTTRNDGIAGQQVTASGPSGGMGDRLSEDAGRSQRPSRFDLYKAKGATGAADMTTEQRRQIAVLIDRYVARTAGSKRSTEKFRSVLADPRAAAGFNADWKEMVYPIVAVRAHGSRLWDVDGNEYIDLVNGYGQTAFGHAPAFVTTAIKEQLEKGFAIGPQAELAGDVARLVVELTGNERVAFCNTGSEAVMAALRVARTVTGRDRVVMFNGAYHGQFDEVLVKGMMREGQPFTLPVTAGIPESAVGNIIVLDSATPASLRWIEQNVGDLAAVVAEPVQSRHPDLKPVKFLRELRRITEAAGTAFVMDEVVTGFRTHPGGIQALTGISADLVTYGKVVGGGMPIGILAGKSKFMDALDGGMWRYGDDSAPEAAMTFFAGTFVRHPLALAAARAVLEHLKEQGTALHAEVICRTTSLVIRLNDLFEAHGLETRVETFASWFYFDLSGEHPFARLLFYLLRDRGIYIQDGFPCFLTTAHSDDDMERIARAFEESLVELDALKIFPPRPEGPVDFSRIASLLPAGPTGQQMPVRPTESQMEIWLAAQLGDEASCAFNESITLRLKGELDETAFREAWQRVIARHDALRACFGPTGEALQVNPDFSFTYPVLDLTGECDPQETLAAHIDRDGRTPFDLAEGPLVRGQLVRLSPDEAAFVFTAHHIVCDGWSANVILDELATFYAGLREGRTPVLTPPLAFRDYAQSKRDEVPEVRSAIETYWLKQFERPLPALELPLDRPRAATRSFHGGTRTCQIQSELYRAVKDTGAGQRCTLFVMLLAAFQILLNRLADQMDLVVGVPTAGQSLLEDEVLVGQCVNFLPIRSELSREMRLGEYLASLREQVLAAYEHQDYTLGTLVRKLAPRRETGRLPLTEVQFNLERLMETVPLPGLEIEVEPNAKAYVNFDLFVNVIESADGLRIDCDYNSDLWDAATIDRWLEYYRVLLDSMVRGVGAPISALGYIPDAERHQLTAEWNRTTQDYPRTATIQSFFEAHAMARPDAVAAVAGEDTITYRGLDVRANKLANLLPSRTDGKAGLIGVAMERSLEMPVALLGILKAGHAYVPLDLSQPPARLRAILAEGGVSALVTDCREGEALAPPGTPVIRWDEQIPMLDAMPADPLTIAASPDDLAYVIYTSGSTGEPKGVEITHRSVVNLLCAMAREPGLSSTDVMLSPTTIAFDIAALELFLPLSVGARTVIATSDDARDGFALMRRMDTAQVTAMQATPTTWQMLIEAGFRCPAGFKMLCGGEALSRRLANELLRGEGELWNMYGPTETTIWSSCVRIEAGEKPVTVGTLPIANTQFYILDDNDQLVPIGKTGQLHIGGDGLARGYFNNPAMTAAKFIDGPFECGRLYRTGDRVRRLPDGGIEILGRQDRQVKLRGFRFELDEIEATVSRETGLATAVLLREDLPGTRRLVGYVADREATAPSAADIRRRLSALLPDYMVPRVWVRLDALPLTASGKIDRAALPAPEDDGDEVVAPVAATTTIQRKLAEIWERVLGQGTVGMTDDLLDLGADSIQIFQITARANREGIRLSAKQLIQARTIEALSRQMETREASPDDASAPQGSMRRARREPAAIATEELRSSGIG